jgi:hypothetical protein
MSILTDYLDLAAEEAAAALSVAHGDGLEDGQDFVQSRYMAEILELAETLNRAAAICHKPGVADLLAERIHSRRLAACVEPFQQPQPETAVATPAPSPASPPQPQQPEPEPEDAADLADPEPDELPPPPAWSRPRLSPAEAAVYRVLAESPANYDRLAESTGYTRASVLGALTRLRRLGLAQSSKSRPAIHSLIDAQQETVTS